MKEDGSRGRILWAGACFCLGLAPGIGVSLGVSPEGQWEPRSMAEGVTFPGALDFFLANLVVVGALASGLVTCGIPAAIGLFALGTQLGAVLGRILKTGMPVAVACAAILPHGVPEILSYLLAGSVGLIGWSLAHGLAAGRSFDWRILAREIGTPLAASLLLLLAAAAIEAYGTPIVLDFVVETARKQ